MNFGAALLGGFGIYVVKPLVLIFNFILILRFWRLNVTGGRVILFGLISFFTAEVICAVESYIIFQISPSLDIMHSVFSATALSLITYGLFLFFDKYYLHYINNEKPCFFIRFCEECPRKSNKKCKFHRVVIWSVILLILMSTAPLFTEVKSVTVNLADYILPWASLNKFYDQQFYPFMEKYIGGYTQADLFICISYESRYVLDRIFPAIALISLLAGLFLLLLNKSDKWAVLFLSLGFGAIGFCYFELVLYKINPYIYVGSVGEEVVELASLFLLIEMFKLMRNKACQPTN